MASARSLLALVPAAAAVPVVVISASSSQLRRTAPGLSSSSLSGYGRSGAAAACQGFGLQHTSGGLLRYSSSSSSSLVPSSLRRTRAGLASLLVLVASSAANSAMAVAQDEKEENMTEGNGSTASDLLTEFMVKMSCEGCVKSVRTKLEPLEGGHTHDSGSMVLHHGATANFLGVVRILGSAPIKTLSSAIEQTGRDARLIGQGLPSNFAISAAVAEFKGPEVKGVVRFAQVSMELSRIDASFSGLRPGSHAWTINTYGDLTRGAASTGGVFESESPNATGSKDKPIGDLGIIDVNDEGDADYSGTKLGLQVSDLIGRSVVLYGNKDISQDGITAAVIARSAGVGENYKNLCSCDGTVIWESSSNDFVKL